MSALKDYLTIVKNGIKNGDKIIEALAVASHAKTGNIEPEALAEILKRKELCAACPFNSENAARDRGYSSHVPYKHCTLCICRIGGDDTKEYCLSCNCGMSEWNKRNPDKTPMELKWTAFETKQQTN